MFSIFRFVIDGGHAWDAIVAAVVKAYNYFSFYVIPVWNLSPWFLIGSGSVSDWFDFPALVSASFSGSVWIFDWGSYFCCEVIGVYITHTTLSFVIWLSGFGSPPHHPLSYHLFSLSLNLTTHLFLIYFRWRPSSFGFMWVTSPVASIHRDLDSANF